MPIFYTLSSGIYFQLHFTKMIQCDSNFWANLDATSCNLDIWILKIEVSYGIYQAETLKACQRKFDRWTIYLHKRWRKWQRPGGSSSTAEGVSFWSELK